MKTYETRLAAHVAAVNASHAAARELHAKLLPVFARYVGQKIIKATTGGLLVKLAEEVRPIIAEVEAAHAVQIWKGNSEYSLYYTVKACRNHAPKGSHCGHSYYAEASAYLGILEGKTDLKKTDGDAPALRTDYTPEEVEKLRDACDKAAEAARKAENELHPFGRYTR